MRTKELILTLSAKELFKFILACCTAFYIPVAIISGVLALAGIVPTNFNDKEFTGFLGFIISILTSPIFIGILAIAHWIIIAIGLKIARFWIKNVAKKKSETNE